MRRHRITTVICLTVLTACGEQAGRHPPADERARDSVIGASGLPGARGVGSALRVSDSAVARRAREDSIAAAREP